MNDIFISYLVTTKNTGIELQTLLERLYKYGSNNECIILDDYSDDPLTLQVLNNVSDNNFFKIYKHKLDRNYSEHKNYDNEMTREAGSSICSWLFEPPYNLIRKHMTLPGESFIPLMGYIGNGEDLKNYLEKIHRKGLSTFQFYFFLRYNLTWLKYRIFIIISQ